MKLLKTYFNLVLIGLSPSIYAVEYANQFTYFDNNVTLGYNTSVIQNSANASMIGVNATALLHNDIWLSAGAASLLTYDLSNNSSGLSNLYQNKSGSSFNLKAGYAFIFDDLNITPYLGFRYNNTLLAYNYDSTQEFIFEDPSYSALAGVNTEYVVITKKLKLGLDSEISYAAHKSVVPNSNTNLGHLDYSQYLITLTPSVQYNINSTLTIIGYYSFGSKFAGTATPPSVYYSAGGTVNSANVVSNDNITKFVWS